MPRKLSHWPTKNRPSLTTILLALGLSMTCAQADSTKILPVGTKHHWSNASKQAVGTAFGRSSSRVWFTVGNGILNEVYYPRVDMAQVGDSQLLFSGLPGDTGFLEEKRDFTYEVKHPTGVPRISIKSTSKKTYGPKDKPIEFIKEILTDPERPVVRIRYKILSIPENTLVYLLHKPTVDNDGAHDIGRILKIPTGQALIAYDEELSHPTFQAILTDAKIKKSNVGVVGENDGWKELNDYGKIVNENTIEGPANISFTAELEIKPVFEIAIGFGPSPESAIGSAAIGLKLDFDEVRDEYDRGWHSYHERLLSAPWLANLPPPISDSVKEEMIWNASLIKAHEDKENSGAIVASLSIPSIPNGKGLPEDGKNTGGYHLVWPRDLFKSGLALLRMGDRKTAYNVLLFMMRQEHDGKMAQNTWVDGTPFWTGEQLDQEAFPILLAGELRDAGVTLDSDVIEFLKRRTARLRSSLGSTGQERWEEVGGFSPNTIAVMAGAFQKLGDIDSAKRMLEIALQKTVVSKGPLSRNPYFLRIAQKGHPDAGDILLIANGGRPLPENVILDGGFLEWVRWFPNPEKVFGNELGSLLRSVVQESLLLLDNPANGVATPYSPPLNLLVTNSAMPLYKRYTGDAYGLNHEGGPWPILTLERALTKLADNPRSAFRYLKFVRDIRGPGDLCPEQLDVSTSIRPMPHAASPLVWCHAEMIELAYQATMTESTQGTKSIKKALKLHP